MPPLGTLWLASTAEHVASLPAVTGLLDVAERVWPVLLFLALIQVVADLCDDAGLFDVSAHVAARVAGGNRLRLFLLFTLLATVCTWVLSIDTTAVLLAPIGLALAGRARAGRAAVRVRVGLAGELRQPAAAGLEPDQPAGPVARRRGRGGVRARRPGCPSWRCWWWCSVVLLVRHRVALRGSYDVPRVLPSYDPVLLWTSAAVVVGDRSGDRGRRRGLGGGARGDRWCWSLAFVVRRPASVRPGRLVRLVPWSVIAFAVALFAVVEVVVEEGSSLLESLFGTGDSLGSLFQLAGSTGVLANVVNNLPAYLVVEPFTHTSDRLVTALVAVNVGPMLLAWGSLANLLWLRACRTRGLEISMVRFGLEGLLVVPLAVAAGVLAVSLG